MIDNRQDLFEEPFVVELEGGSGVVTISLEKEKIGEEETATGRFIIDMEHTSGRYQFFMDLEPEDSWSASGECPDFLDQPIINEIGNRIADHFEEEK